MAAKLFIAFVTIGLIPFLGAVTLLVFGYEALVKETLGLFQQSIGPDEQERLRQTIADLRLQAGLTMFVISALVVFGSIALSQILIRPVRELLRGVRDAGQGNLAATIRVETRDEIGQLAWQINDMVARLRELREREALISRAKSEFISIAAHQLRTPLSAVKWTFRLVLDGDMGAISPEQAKGLQKGYDANERMIHLVSDLLDVVRIEEGRFGYSLQEADIQKIIAGSVEELAVLAKKRGIRLAALPSKEDLPPVFVDSERMALVLSNLLANAINYTLPGGSVTVAIRAHPTEVEVAIQDTGIGIPRAQMDRLFTKFFRADNVLRMQTEGSGLGLFIVKNILQRHGGKIWAESEEGRGSTFHFTLPLEKRRIPEREVPFEEFIASI